MYCPVPVTLWQGQGVHHDFVLCLYAWKYVQPDLIAHPSGILLLARRSTILVVDRGIILPES